MAANYYKEPESIGRFSHSVSQPSGCVSIVGIKFSTLCTLAAIARGANWRGWSRLQQRWNTSLASPSPQLRPELVAVVAPCRLKQSSFSATAGAPPPCAMFYIGRLSRGQAQTDGLPLAVHPGTELGIRMAALGTPNRLILLATSGIACILMHLDVAGVDKPQLALSFPRQRPQ